MQFLSVMKKLYFYILLGILFVGGASETGAQVDGGIGISAARIETVIPAGGEKTVGMVVDYTRDFPEAKLPTARLVARLEDWTIKPDGDLKFAPASTLERSAAAWVTYGPAEFNLVADARQVVRFTISVPKNTAPGDYLVACYFEGRDTPPPPTDGSRQLYVKFRYYTMIYVMVPGLTTGGELQALEAKNVDGALFVIPKLANTGNSRLRPKHSVEIRDAGDKTVFNSAASAAMVVLGNRSWQMPYPLTADLPAGDYKLIYNVDFGDKKAIHVGKTNFSITEADIAARKKKTETTTANNKPADTKPADGKATENKPADSKTTDGKTVEISTAATTNKVAAPIANKPPQ